MPTCQNRPRSSNSLVIVHSTSAGALPAENGSGEGALGQWKGRSRRADTWPAPPEAVRAPQLEPAADVVQHQQRRVERAERQRHVVGRHPRDQLLALRTRSPNQTQETRMGLQREKGPATWKFKLH